MTLEAQFRDLAQDIAPSRNWRENAARGVNDLFRLLQSQRTPSKYRPDRCQFVGGFEKQTSTKFNTDVDVVIYYNDPNNNLKREDVLKTWEGALQGTNFRVLAQTPFLLMLKWNDIPIDLVAVRNRVSFPHGNVDLSQMQADLKWARSSANPFKASKQLTLSIQSVDWMKGLPDAWLDFTRNLARLCKYWVAINKKKYSLEKESGLSYIIELLAVRASMDQAGKGAGKSFVQAFGIFLNQIINIRDVVEMWDDKNYPRMFSLNEVPPTIRGQRPLLLNPVLPFQNMLDPVPNTILRLAEDAVLDKQVLKGPYSSQDIKSALFEILIIDF